MNADKFVPQQTRKRYIHFKTLRFAMNYYVFLVFDGMTLLCRFPGGIPLV